MFVEANVLMNVKADEYVAVFGVAEEGATVAECATKMEATLKAFAAETAKIGVDPKDFVIDFIAQNKIYGFEVSGDLAREKLVGFELKKNALVHYRDAAMLDKLMIAASAAKIFDLIKVDYIVNDIGRVEDRVMEEAEKIIKRKAARYQNLLGKKILPAQVYAERPSVHYPTAMYDSYTAQESEQFNAGFDRQRTRVQSARKSRTFYYNGLDGDGFDSVINPVAVEPMVQFTLYLKVKYDSEPAKAR